MKRFLSVACILIPMVASAEMPKANVWLSGSLYGSDNDVASLRKVTISEANHGYRIKIYNQFVFECELEFDKNGNPSELRQCLSHLNEKTKWSAAPDNIKLNCFYTKSEHICKGKYTLISEFYRDEAEFSIARKK